MDPLKERATQAEIQQVLDETSDKQAYSAWCKRHPPMREMLIKAVRYTTRQLQKRENAKLN